MEMRTGGEPRHAHLADDFTLMHARTAVGEDPAQVAVARRDAVAMADLDEVAITSRLAGADHRAVARRHDRCPGGGGEIASLMFPGLTEHRMEARAGEARGGPPEFHRRAQECTLQGLAVLVEEAGPLVAGEAEGGVVAAVHRQVAREHTAEADFALVRHEALEHHG